MSKPPSLLVAIPCRDFLRATVWPQLCLEGVSNSNLFWKKTYGWDATFSLAARPGAHVQDARNEIAELAQVREYDWVLWMDDDAVPPPNMLQRLMESGKDFIAPVFTTKNPPYKPCCFRLIDNHMDPVLDIDPPRLFRADGTGFHVVLMKTEVLTKTQDWIWESQLPRKDLFQSQCGLSEDLFFCTAAKNAGCELWIDSRIEVGHGSEYIATPQHFRAHRDRMRSALQQEPTAQQYA